MFHHDKRTQYTVRVEKPNPLTGTGSGGTGSGAIASRLATGVGQAVEDLTGRRRDA